MLLKRENFNHPEFRQGLADMMGVATGIAAWGLMTGVAMAGQRHGLFRYRREIAHSVSPCLMV